MVACDGHSQGQTANCPDQRVFQNDRGKVGPGTVQLMAALSKMNLLNPIADLNSNIANGDRRFIGMNSYSCSEPGVKAGDQALVDRFHTHCLEGSGDIVEGQLHFQLMEAATAYASTYNTELIRLIRVGKIT
jgi:hypothetical protein